MSYTHVTVKLSPGQINKLKAKTAKECGTTITLKPAQMNTGEHKLSLTATQKKHYDGAVKTGKGVQLNFSKAAINDMIKTGGIFPLFAAIPGLLAAAAPAIAKAVGLGAAGAIGTNLMGKVFGKGYEKKTTRRKKQTGAGLRLPGTYLGRR